MEIQKYFPFLKNDSVNNFSLKEDKKDNMQKQILPESLQGKINSSKFKLETLEHPESLPPKKKELYNVALEFQSLFIKMMLNSMRSTLNKENDLLHGGRVQEIFEDMLYDEYAKTYSKTANLPLAKEIYLQLEKFIQDDEDNKAIIDIKETMNKQKDYIKKIEGIISTDQIKNEWYK